MSVWSTEIPLVGAGGEPVELRRTLLSHGFVELPPMRLDEDVPSLELTLALYVPTYCTGSLEPAIL